MLVGFFFACGGVTAPSPSPTPRETPPATLPFSCPPAHPKAGEACEEAGARCGYDRCLFFECNGGVWTGGPTCPVDAIPLCFSSAAATTSLDQPVSRHIVLVCEQPTAKGRQHTELEIVFAFEDRGPRGPIESAEVRDGIEPDPHDINLGHLCEVSLAPDTSWPLVPGDHVRGSYSCEVEIAYSDSNVTYVTDTFDVVAR